MIVFMKIMMTVIIVYMKFLTIAMIALMITAMFGEPGGTSPTQLSIEAHPAGTGP